MPLTIRFPSVPLIIKHMNKILAFLAAVVTILGTPTDSDTL